MIEALIGRTRFYDITGYLIPGEIMIGIMWLYARVFGWSVYANKALDFVSEHWVASTVLIFFAGAYTIGHLVNAASKVFLEKFLLASAYEKNADWLSRVKKDNTGRGAEILACFEKKFGYKPDSGNKPSAVIQGWAEHELPAPSHTTFRFLCFYGMNRAFAFLNLLIIPPVAYWILMHSHFCCMILSIIVCLATSSLFGFQYLRFVKVYSNSLPELLLMKREMPET